MAVPARKVLLSGSSFPDRVSPDHPLYLPPPTWPASWIGLPGAVPPMVAAFRLRFDAGAGGEQRLHVTADERYELWLDGELVGRGTERSQPFAWAFDTYEVTLSAGAHVLVALVWALGRPHRAAAQGSLRPGFLLAPDDAELRDAFATGHAPWRVRRLGGRTWLPKGPCFGTSAFERLSGEAGDVGWRTGDGGGWEEPVRLAVGSNALGTYRGTDHRLRPSELPAMLDLPWTRGTVRHVDAVESRDTRPVAVRRDAHLATDAAGWQRWWDAGEALTLPPHTRRRVILDLEDYVCAHVELRTRGGAGAFIRWHTAEALYATPEPAESGKGHRDEIEGRHFLGWGDEFLPDGGERTFAPLWWRCGRYVELLVETEDEPLTVVGVTLREIRYPYRVEMEFACGDERLLAALPVCERALAMCAHDAFFDCPYYEQLMYFGDLGVQALALLATNGDARLVRHALFTAHRTRWFDGTIAGNVGPGGMMLPTFGLYWIVLVHDYLRWRDDRDTLRELLPGVRATLDFWLKHAPPGEDALIVTPPGFNFVDWVAWSGDKAPLAENGWHTGTPPGALPGERSFVLNWQLVWTLGLAADLERAAGEPELAARWQRIADRLVAILERDGWSEDRGACADEPTQRTFSQHAQLFALLSGRLPAARAARALHALLHDATLALATLSFSSYLLEVLYRHGQADAFQERLEEWRRMPERGFKTCYEVFWNGTRSDCHAWAAHPLYHARASMLGLRPASFGFATARVAPLLRPGEWARGRVPHPRGEVAAELARDADGRVHGTVALPADVPGEFLDLPTGRTLPLLAGVNRIDLAPPTPLTPASP